MDTALLGLRVALSLACVLGLIWFAGRRLQGTGAVRRQRSVPLSVLGRQSLGKGAGIALVEVAGRVLLLGVGEQGVRVLTEVDVPPTPAVPARSAERGEIREEIDLSALPVPAGAVVAPADAVVAQPDDGVLHADVVAPADVVVSHADVVDADADANANGDADAAADADANGDAEADADPDGDVDAADPDADAPRPDDADAPAGAEVPQAHPDGAARMAALAGLAAGKSASEAGALHGSALSPDTWRRAVDVVQRRTGRR